jgi:cyanophycinase-like exopeptidase
MSAGVVYLVGSGQHSLLGDIAARALAATKKKRPRVAISHAPIAENKQGLAFMKKMAAKMFHGAEVASFAVQGEPHSMSAGEARAIVDEADLVFVSGGDPALGAKLLVEAGADEWLRAARARGAAIMGVSAGSIVLGAYWAEWPEEPPKDDPNEGARLVPCVGVAGDLVVDTHNEEDGWDELHVVRRLAHAAKKKGRFVGIPTGGAIVIGAGDRFESVGNAAVVLDA